MGCQLCNLLNTSMEMAMLIAIGCLISGCSFGGAFFMAVVVAMFLFTFLVRALLFRLGTFSFDRNLFTIRVHTEPKEQELIVATDSSQLYDLRIRAMRMAVSVLRGNIGGGSDLDVH